MVDKIVKARVNAAVWYTFRSTCRRGEVKKNVEEALKLYFALRRGNLPSTAATVPVRCVESEGEKYVYFRVDQNLWREFRRGLMKGDVGSAFTEALKLYLGSLWGTLAFREVWVVDTAAELRRSLVNLAFEDFGEARYLPLDGEFSAAVLEVVMRKLGEPVAVVSLPDLERVEAEPKEAFSKGYVLLFEKDGKQFALSKTFFGPSSISI